MTLTCMVASTALLSLLVAGASAGAVLGDQLPILTSGRNPRDHAIPCPTPLNADPGKYQCGLFSVPLNYDDPARGDGCVYYARLPASPAVVRRGTIFVDPGYPFALVEGLTPQDWLYNRGDALRNRTQGEYDIVVWDARGKGVHNLTIPGPAQCFSKLAERSAFYKQTYADWEWTSLHLNTSDAGGRPGARDVHRWNFVQQKFVARCLEVLDTEMLRYVGTAATARDVLEMAGAFDGRGSAVNFWGMGDGTRVGSYLMRLFPERAGRIILEAPVDLTEHLTRDPYEIWKEDIAHAAQTFKDFANACGQMDNIGGEEDGCRIAHQQDLEDVPASTQIVDFMYFALSFTRASLTGQRAFLHQDLTNRHLTTLFRTLAERAARDSRTALNVTAALATVNDIALVPREALGLGVMPIVCGDRADDSEHAAAEGGGAKVVGRLLRDRVRWQIVIHEAFPSLHYMCHLWPIRAVDRPRLPENPPAPAHPVLVVEHEMNPVAKMMDKDKRVWPEGTRRVVRKQFGIPSFAHSQCASTIVADYLRNGTLPAHDTFCSGNPLSPSLPSSSQPSDSDAPRTPEPASLPDSPSSAAPTGRWEAELRWAAWVVGFVLCASGVMILMNVGLKRLRREGELKLKGENE
ncbi:hypothetical protein OH77DRAFT_1517930 [Trametes cingulata]|nr:hypothetical protein OH77DRAFT_1517930 [Trametes cingulata]